MILEKFSSNILNKVSSNKIRLVVLLGCKNYFDGKCQKLKFSTSIICDYFYSKLCNKIML